MEIGHNIQQRREDKGMSQQDLADYLGIYFKVGEWIGVAKLQKCSGFERSFLSVVG